jgi:hypothetical protein
MKEPFQGILPGFHRQPSEPKPVDPDLERGILGYVAYCRRVDFVTWDGRPVPRWEQLTDKIRQAWIYQAKVVAEAELEKLDKQRRMVSGGED